MIKIANVKGMRPNIPGIIYCGRTFGGWKGSVLGNPFKGERTEAIAKYRDWLYEQYRRDDDLTVYNEIDRIAQLTKTTDVILGCWCSPLPCHCEVIKELVELHHKTKSIRLIVAGSRTINDKVLVYHCIDFTVDWLKEHAYGRKDIEIVSGCARGVDFLGIQYAMENKMDVTSFPADWDKEGRSAGFRRNERMAEYANCLCLVWDGKSAGSKHMLETAKAKGLKIFQKVI